MTDAQAVGPAATDAPLPEEDASITDAAIEYRQYRDERDLQVLKDMIDAELVEPYTVFTFRMFVGPWPQLCFFCYVGGAPAGVVVCKIDRHKSGTWRGYLGMIVVTHEHRKRGIGRKLARMAIEAMDAEGVHEVVLECETENKAAQRLYHTLGFVRDKRLQCYYFCGTDAYRLKLRLRDTDATKTRLLFNSGADDGDAAGGGGSGDGAVDAGGRGGAGGDAAGAQASTSQ